MNSKKFKDTQRDSKETLFAESGQTKGELANTRIERKRPGIEIVIHKRMVYLKFSFNLKT